MMRALAGLALLAAVAQARSLEVEDLHTDVVIRADGTTEITETIQVAFRGSWHGIYRYIPYRYEYPNGLRATLHLALDAVEDGAGNELWHKTSREDGNLRVKIAVPDANDATRTVVLRYRTRNVLKTYQEQDEFYWNVTGNGWPCAIRHASASVTLPGIPADEVRTTAYTGSYGARGEGWRATPRGDGVDFETTAPLPPHAGLTIVVGFPVGYVEHPTRLQEAWWLFQANWGVLFPLGAALAWVLLWYFRGRDSLAGATIVPEFEPPFGLRPTQVGVIVDEKLHRCDVSAGILDLAVRGYFDIDCTEKTPKFHLKKKNWRGGQDLTLYEKELMEALFEGRKETATPSSNRLGRRMPDIRHQLLEQLVREGYFVARPDEVRTAWYLGTAGALIAALLGGVVYATWWVALLLLVPCGTVMFLCARWMPRRTKRGLEALRRVRGLEDYLETAEKERLKDMPRDHFEKLLPYAVALGVQDNWTHVFRELFAEPPAWLAGGASDRLDDVLPRFLVGTQAAMFYTPPRSSFSGGSGGGWGGGWSGGSGFSGGGDFSGGGFGGGGGGGW